MRVQAHNQATERVADQLQQEERGYGQAERRRIQGDLLQALDGVDGVFLLASLWLGECVNDPRSAWARAGSR